jgi:formamidopyrimidine-DNA glycosylase
MPELPEVETVVRQLQGPLVGRRVLAATVRHAATVGGDRARFRRAVVGATVSGVVRRAKYLVFALQREGRAAGVLVGHLRMTGRMFVERAEHDPGPHGQVRLDLDDGRCFQFVDVRRFGRLQFARLAEELLPPLGPEPLGEEFTVAWFRAALGARRRALKALLLDQSFLAGLGNIYVDEALHRAGLHPLRPADRLRPAAVERLHGAIRSTLAAAIEREGSSFDAFYRTPEGRPGSYQHLFQVYGREGEPCSTCGRKVERRVIAGRGTHLCPRCQPAPRG